MRRLLARNRWPVLFRPIVVGCLFAAAPGWAAAPGEENERDALIQPTSGGPNYLAAAGLIGFVLGAGSTWYAYSPDTNAKDWLYDYSWETLKKKLITGEAIQLDDNPLFLNSPGHPLAGTVYYLVARYNRFPAWASFLITNFASFAWELATEFREEMSINDVLMTPVGGFAFGESLYSFTDFFWSARPRADNPALSDFFLPLQRPTAGSGFGPPLRSARILDGAGYPADTWYRFNVSLGAEGHKSPQVGFCSHWGLEGALIKSAAYDRPATLSRGFATPFATRLQLQLSLGERGVDRGRIRAEVAYLGLYGQQLEPWGAGVSGVAGYLAFTALYHHEEEHPLGLDDQLGAVALFGLEGHGAVHLGLFRLRATGFAYPVFAAVRSLAWAESAVFSAGHGDTVPPVLSRFNYYWAAGMHFKATLTLEYRELTWLTWEYRRYQLTPVERWLGRPTQGGEREDERLTQTLSLTQTLPGEHFGLRLSTERTFRTSVYDRQQVAHEDFRVQLALLWGASR